MHRKYLSGNAKRKLKHEKEKRHEQLMNKIPKLTSERFQRKENTENQSVASTSETNVETAATAGESEEQYNTDDSDWDSCDSSLIDLKSLSIDAQSNDPGLWNLQTNRSTLQAYWIQHGTQYFIVFKFCFT